MIPIEERHIEERITEFIVLDIVIPIEDCQGSTGSSHKSSINTSLVK